MTVKVTGSPINLGYCQTLNIDWLFPSCLWIGLGRGSDVEISAKKKQFVHICNFVSSIDRQIRTEKTSFLRQADCFSTYGSSVGYLLGWVMGP